MKASYLYLFSGLLSATMLVGCGGSSGGGSAATADISADNADDLSVAATEAAKAAIDAESSGGNASSIPTFFKSSGSLASSTQAKVINSIRQATTNYSGYFCPSGGQAILNYSGSNTTGSVSFNDCNDGTAIYNGSMSWSGDVLGSTGSYTFTYNNFQVTSGGTTQTVSGTVTCTSGGMNCNYSSLNVGQSLSNADFSGDDGRQYRFQGNVTVSGDDTNGWNVNATVVDPDHGAITITAENITFASCANGVPNGGTITVTGNGQTATVTFIDCNSFSLNYNGSTTTHNWSSYGL